MDNFLFPELTIPRAQSRLRKLRARRRIELASLIGPGGEGQADEKPGPGPGTPAGTNGALDPETGTMLTFARLDEFSTGLMVIEEIEDRLAKNPKTLEKLRPELRSFYTAYQLHLRTQVPTNRPNIVFKRQRNALIAGRNAMAAHHIFNALGQGAAKTVSDAIRGVGAMINSDKTTQVGRNLERRIERTLPVPGMLENTRTLANARRDGRVAAMAATAAAGVVRGAAARMAAGAIDAAGAGGRAAIRAAELGRPQVAQQRAALVAAADEILGTGIAKLGAKVGRALLQRHLGIGKGDLDLSDLTELNDFLAPKGLRVLRKGIIERFKARENK